MCHQSVGLIARNAEAAGIPTLSMGSALDIMQAVNPPRAAFLDFLWATPPASRINPGCSETFCFRLWQA